MKDISNYSKLRPFLNEDYINWSGKAANVWISGRNYQTGYELVNLINQHITKMLGNSIAE